MLLLRVTHPMIFCSAVKAIYPLIAAIGVGGLFQTPLICLQAAMPFKDMATSTATFVLLRCVPPACFHPILHGPHTVFAGRWVGLWVFPSVKPYGLVLVFLAKSISIRCGTHDPPFFSLLFRNSGSESRISPRTPRTRLRAH